jgi:integrase
VTGPARCIASCAGIPAFTLRETRHSFVSQMSQAGVDIEVIADHVGHMNSSVTRDVYRHQLADKAGAAAMVFDELYKEQEES